MIKQTLYKLYKRFEKWLIATGIIVVAFGAGETQFQKGGLLYDGISTQKVVEKFALADNKIKSKYQLDGNELKIPAPDKNSVAVSLGDKTKPEFEPKLEITRWEGKAKFSIKPKGLELIQKKDKDLTFIGDKIKFETPDITYEYFDAPTSTEEGGYEYQLVLNKKPATSTFYSTIDSTGLEFYKQLPLTQEQAREGETCYETYCEKDGQRTSERPDNVVNSYAVYYSESGDYSKMGGYNFRAGKAFHIYRVKAIDADGLELWCDQNIYGNTHEISCDWNWLDKAKYPVKIDPTLGYTSMPANSTGAWWNQLVYAYFDATQNGTVTKLTFAIDYTSSVSSTCAMYNDSANKMTPTCKEKMITDLSKHWEDFELNSGTLSIVNGDTYYMGILLARDGATNNGGEVAWDYASKNGSSQSQAYSSGLPASITSPGKYYTFGIYATYEAASTYSRNSTTTINNGRIKINNGRLNIR